MKKFFLIFLPSLLYFGGISANTYVTAVIFEYDAAGNRLVRRIGTVCTDCGPCNCPNGKMSYYEDTLKTNSWDESSNNILVLKIYPNPFTNHLTVENPGWTDTDKAEVTLHDIAGKQILRKTISTGRENVPIHEIAPGTYQLHYYLNGKPRQFWKVTKN